MDAQSERNAMLQLLPQPAFWVENGVISQVNHGAAAYLLQPGEPFVPMILCGGQEYEEFVSGKLYLTLSLSGKTMGACVSRMGNGDIVTLEQSAELPHLQAMSLAAMELRKPMNGLMSLAEQMLPAVAEQGAEIKGQASQMNQRLYQMLRIINNMSDAAGFVQAQSVQLETIEMCAFLEEILEKTASLTQSSGISLTYDLPREPVFTLADREKLERAVYNLLSNAIKFAAPQTCVQAKLTRKNKRLYISITNTHSNRDLQGNIYSRFLREPALEDPRDGIGLGMVLVRSTATLHGGAVMVDKAENGSRFTITLQEKTHASSQVRSPVVYLDYASERDHCLLELADVLPAQLFSPDQIK